MVTKKDVFAVFPGACEVLPHPDDRPLDLVPMPEADRRFSDYRECGSVVGCPMNGIRLLTVTTGSLFRYPCRVCYAYLTCTYGDWERQERSLTEIARAREAHRPQRTASKTWDELLHRMDDSRDEIADHAARADAILTDHAPETFIQPAFFPKPKP